MANTMNSYTKSYNSFAGSDMVVTFNKTIVGELQGLSYTVQREKAPMYVLGNADPVSFSRGKRGIAGSLVFLMFDRSALLDAFADSPFLAWVHDFAAVVGDPITTAPSVNTDAIPGTAGASSAVTGGVAQSIALDKVLVRPVYHDQILPFEVVVTAVNEYGANANMKVHGVEIINVGSGFSIDDMQIDEACTFIARALTNWKPGTQIKIPNFTLNTDTLTDTLS